MKRNLRSSKVLELPEWALKVQKAPQLAVSPLDVGILRVRLEYQWSFAGGMKPLELFGLPAGMLVVLEVAQVVGGSV